MGTLVSKQKRNK